MPALRFMEIGDSRRARRRSGRFETHARRGTAGGSVGSVRAAVRGTGGKTPQRAAGRVRVGTQEGVCYERCQAFQMGAARGLLGASGPSSPTIRRPFCARMRGRKGCVGTCWRICASPRPHSWQLSNKPERAALVAGRRSWGPSIASRPDPWRALSAFPSTARRSSSRSSCRDRACHRYRSDH